MNLANLMQLAIAACLLLPISDCTIQYHCASAGKLVGIADELAVTVISAATTQRMILTRIPADGNRQQSARAWQA